MSGDYFAGDETQSIILNISYASFKESKCSVIQYYLRDKELQKIDNELKAYGIVILATHRKQR